MPLRHNETMQEFIADMETGGYAPDSTNAIRRLNDVCRKYEALLKPPQLQRQPAQRRFSEPSVSSGWASEPSRSAPPRP